MPQVETNVVGWPSGSGTTCEAVAITASAEESRVMDSTNGRVFHPQATRIRASAAAAATPTTRDRCQTHVRSSANPTPAMTIIGSLAASWASITRPRQIIRLSARLGGQTNISPILSRHIPFLSPWIGAHTANRPAKPKHKQRP